MLSIGGERATIRTEVDEEGVGNSELRTSFISASPLSTFLMTFLPPIFPILPIVFFTGAGLAASLSRVSSSKRVIPSGGGGSGGDADADADDFLSPMTIFTLPLPEGLGGGETEPSGSAAAGSFPFPLPSARATTTVSESSVSSPAAISGISTSGARVGGGLGLLGFSAFLPLGLLRPAALGFGLDTGDTILGGFPAAVRGMNFRGGGRSRSSESD